MSNLKYAHLCYGFPLLDEDGEPVVFKGGREFTEVEGVSFDFHDVDAEICVDIVSVTESQHQASSRDNPTSIANLEVKPEWRAMLESFCRCNDLKFEEPSWILSVSWDK